MGKPLHLFHLMDFDRVQQYTLAFKEGPFTGESWELQDNLGIKVQEVASYVMISNSVSEVHKIVFTCNDQSTTEFAVVGVSICKTSHGINESKT